MKRHLNHLFIQQLPTLLRMTLKSFYKKADISIDIWNYRTEEPEGWRVREVIRICNAFQLPSELLFIQDSECAYIPTAEDLYTYRKNFKRIRFDLEAFDRAWKKRDATDLNKTEKAEAIGVKIQTVNQWFRNGEEMPITVSLLLQFCDKFGYDILDFIKSEEKDVQVEPARNHVSNKRKSVNLKQENEELREQICRLEKQLEVLHKMNSMLAKRVRELEEPQELKEYIINEEVLMIAAEGGQRENITDEVEGMMG